MNVQPHSHNHLGCPISQRTPAPAPWEILKTLWKEFNKVSPSTKPMSAAHRREVCDDFMRDSNWKKLVGICLWFLLVPWKRQLTV